MADLETSAVTPTGIWNFTFFKQGTVTALGSGDATPTVLSKNVFQTAGTTAITDFDDGVVGQCIHVQAKTSIKITHNASNIVLSGGADFDMVSGDTLTLFMFDNGVWSEVGRGHNHA